MITHTLDARVLNPGDSFYAANYWGAVTLADHSVRRALRVHVRSGSGTLEILHGRSDGHPGSLEYTVLPIGARVVVPLI